MVDTISGTLKCVAPYMVVLDWLRPYCLSDIYLMLRWHHCVMGFSSTSNSVSLVKEPRIIPRNPWNSMWLLSIYYIGHVWRCASFQRSASKTVLGWTCFKELIKSGCFCGNLYIDIVGFCTMCYFKTLPSNYYWSRRCYMSIPAEGNAPRQSFCF